MMPPVLTPALAACVMVHVYCRGERSKGDPCWSGPSTSRRLLWGHTTQMWSLSVMCWLQND